MEKETYQRLEVFFGDYTKDFADRADDPKPFENKILHTSKVCENMGIIARVQGRKHQSYYTAMAAALLHDIGRFRQYEIYATFSDAQSENHGGMGAGLVRKMNLLSNLEKLERHQIIHAVALHNVFCLPDNLAPETIELTKLVRDADKVDIYRVMVDLYKDLAPGSTSFITYHLPDDGKISRIFAQDILDQRLIDARHVKTINDMKLLQISWLFDLNFDVSLGLVRQRGYVPAILETMPDTSEMEPIRQFALEYLETR
jgi:hypothetical protein